MRINTREAVWLMFVLLVSKIFFTDLGRFLYTAGTAAYIELFIFTVISLMIHLTFSWFINKGNKIEDIFNLAKFAYGKVGFFITGILSFLLILLNLAIIFKNYSLSIAMITLDLSPVYYIMGFVATGMIFCSLAGIEGVARFSTFLGFIMVVFLVILFFVDIPKLELNNIFPIFGNGLSSFLAGIEDISIFNEIFFLHLLIPHLQKPSEFRKVGVLSILFTGATFVVVSLFYIMTVPYPASLDFSPPLLQISSIVELNVIFQRAESLFMVMWLLSSFLYLGINLCFLLLTFEKTFSLRNHKAVIPIISILIFVISSFWNNTNEARPFFEIYDIVLLISTLVILGTIVISSYLKSKKEVKGKNA